MIVFVVLIVMLVISIACDSTYLHNVAGIYFHIPFCRKACHYCDFHFSTSLKNKEALVDAMLLETRARAHEIEGPVETIYFGGGTPSLLSETDLSRFFETIDAHFEVTADAEVTLEANPDDLDGNYLEMLAGTRVNRLSIGIQSFRDEDLSFMNRTHNARQAGECVQLAQSLGFSNITIDLIYGIPGLSENDWADNLQKAFELKVPHLSAYNLTVEPNTALAHMVKKGKVQAVDDQLSEAHFRQLHSTALANGFEHYEISNLSLPGMHSRHNSSYWLGKHYLGIGPSAHSYNGETRSWNVAHNRRYMEGWQSGNPSRDVEKLDVVTSYNEYILTRLRTKWGCIPKEIEVQFGLAYLDWFEQEIEAFVAAGHVTKQQDAVILTTEGMLLADRIASELFR